MFQVKMRTSSKPSKTYAQIASLPKSQVHTSPATPVNDLDPKHIAKAGLTLERLGYPSPDRVMLLAKDPAYGLGLPSNLSKEAFRVAENDVYQLGKSHKQPNKNLHMTVTATRPWERIHIDISYINITTIKYIVRINVKQNSANWKYITMCYNNFITFSLSKYAKCVKLNGYITM